MATNGLDLNNEQHSSLRQHSVTQATLQATPQLMVRSSEKNPKLE
jgi:hypothetical protein